MAPSPERGVWLALCTLGYDQLPEMKTCLLSHLSAFHRCLLFLSSNSYANCEFFHLLFSSRIVGYAVRLPGSFLYAPAHLDKNALHQASPSRPTIRVITSMSTYLVGTHVRRVIKCLFSNNIMCANRIFIWC